MRVAPLSTSGAPGPSATPHSAGGQAIGPRGAFLASVAPQGQLLIAGAGGGTAIQGRADGPFAPLSGLTGTFAPVSIANAYLGDVALASPTQDGHLQVDVERYYAHSLERRATVGSTEARAEETLTLAMDYRSDALAVWAQGASIYARDIPATGLAHPIQRLGPAGSRSRISVLLSDDNRAIVVWTEESRGETSVWVDHSASGVRFRSPALLERFPNPANASARPAGPRLIRLSSESVMLAWGGVAGGHWVVRSAAIDLEGVGRPTTIAAPTGDALLAGLEPGPDDDALLLWTEPQQTQASTGIETQSIFAARGFDTHPKRTVFDPPEEVAPAGPNSEPTVGLDPANDEATALWRGAGGALEYAIRTPAKAP